APKRMLVEVRRSDGLVRFLSSCRLGAVLAPLVVLVAICRPYFLFRALKGSIAEVHRIGTHIGDAARLVEPLRNGHGARHRESKLPAGFLLQCGSREWCSRTAFGGFGLQTIDYKIGRNAIGKKPFGVSGFGKPLRELGLE